MTYQTYESENIVLKRQEYNQTQYQGGIGNSDVLAKIFPQLLNTGISRSKPSTPLNGVDDYMMKELNELCHRISCYHARSGINTNNEIAISIQRKKIVVIRQPEHSSLSALICADKWLKGAVEWLQPNIVGLVHSLELSAFSKLYQQSVSQALKSYTHFDREDYGLNLIISCNKNKAQVIVESPVHTYIVT